MLVFAHNLNDTNIQDLAIFSSILSQEKLRDKLSLEMLHKLTSKVRIRKVYMQAVYACTIVVASMAFESPRRVGESSLLEKVLELGLTPGRKECPLFACKFLIRASSR